MPTIHLEKPFRTHSHRDPNNPHIKEKKRQSVLIDIQAPKRKTVITTAGTVTFERGMAVMPDDSRAEDILGELKKTEMHPDQYNLVKHREGMWRDREHPMRTTNPGMPWARYDDLGRRLED